MKQIEPLSTGDPEFETFKGKQSNYFDGKNWESHQRWYGEYVNNFPIRFQAFAQANKNRHPNDNNMKESLEP